MKLALHLAGAAVLMAATGVCADQKEKPAPPPKAAAKAPAPPPRNPGGTPKKGGAGMNNPLNPVQRLFQMTPEQRDRILEKLPPEQQARMRQQLEKLDQLSPAEKERIASQTQSLSSLPPARQHVIQQGIAGVNHLPQDRKQPVIKELLTLRNMSEEDRNARLQSDDFKKKFSPDEQKILSDLSTNLPPDYPMAGRR